MLDLAGADAECKSTEGSMGGSVGVAADNGHTGFGRSQLGPDHVDNPLGSILHIEKLHAELSAVLPKGVDLGGRNLVCNEEPILRAGRRHIVIHRCKVAIRTAQLAPRHAQAVKGLWAGDFVHQVQIDVNEGGLAFRLGDHVLFPNFVKECSWPEH